MRTSLHFLLPGSTAPSNSVVMTPSPDRKSGLVQVAGRLDVEEGWEYEFTVKCVPWKDQPQLVPSDEENTATFKLKLLDVNDNPILIQSPSSVG